MWLKLESRNPMGSVKFRTAAGLLAALGTRCSLRPGTRVVESTSGNLGLAMARLLAELDCQLIAVIDPKVSLRMRAALESEGARLVMVSKPDIHGSYLLERLRKVRELLSDDTGLRWTDQYHSLANPAIHRDFTAAEIIKQTDAGVDALFAAVSTGGTLAGLSAGLRASKTGVEVYAVDAHGSLVTSDVSKVHLLSGIGAARKSDFLHPGVYDRAVQIRDVEAFALCRLFATDTGLAVGGSGGAVLAAFIRMMSESASHYRCPVAIIPDGGESYRDTFYSDDWLSEHGVMSSVIAAEVQARKAGVIFKLDLTGNEDDDCDAYR